MATNFPTSEDDATTVGGDGLPAPTTALSDSVSGHPSHSDLHENLGDAVQAIEAKLGTGAGGAVSNSLLAGTGSGTSGWSTSPTVSGTVTAGGLTVDTDTLHVDATNNRVGIGTTSPGAALDIDQAGAANVILNDTSGTVGATTYASAVFQAGGVEAGRVGFATASGILKLENQDGPVYLETESADGILLRTNDTTRMTIDSTGNVGVGTTTPSTDFEVAGDVVIQDVSPKLTLKDNNNTGTSNGILEFTDQTDAILARLFMGAGNDLYIDVGTADFIMTDTGRLGVGTTAPDSQFHTISSTSRAFVFDRQQDLGTNNVTCGIMKMGTDADNAGTGDYWIQFRRGDSTVVGSIRGTGSASVNYDTTSDQTLKTDLGVTSQEDTAAIIDSLTVHNFDWIDARPGLGSQIGLFAQEAMPHLPDSIVSDSDTDEDGNYIPASLDYSKIVPILIAEIQFLRERVAALEP